MITQCCACRKVRQGEHWVEQTQALPSGEQVSHGYCPVCARDAYRAANLEYDDRKAASRDFESGKPAPIFWQDSGKE